MRSQPRAGQHLARRLAIGCVLVVALFAIAACRRGAPLIDTAPKPIEPAGTISGTIRGPQGTSLVQGRTVEIISVETGERQQARTNNTGGFTLKVKPGRYRVELALRHGETLVQQPGTMNVEGRDAGAQANFVLGTVRVSRPRSPTYRTDIGLGSPIA